MYHKLPGRARTEESFASVLISLLTFFGFFFYPNIRILSSTQKLFLLGLVVILLLTIGILVNQIHRRNERIRLMRKEAYDLSPTDFEKRIALLCQDLGWQDVIRIGGSNDKGVDIRAVNNGKKYVIQCKRYKGIVQPERVRELLGTREDNRASGALLVTTGRFGSSSIDFARKHNIELWDGETVGRKMLEAHRMQQHPEMRRQERRKRVLLFSALIFISSTMVILSFFNVMG